MAWSDASLCTVFSSADCGALEKACGRAFAEGNRQHPEVGVKAEREVRRARAAKPEMFAPTDFPSAPVKRGAKLRWESFREEQLALAQGTEWNSARGVSTFMKHGAASSLLLLEFCLPETSNERARKGPNRRSERKDLLARVCSELDRGLGGQKYPNVEPC